METTKKYLRERKLGAAGTAFLMSLPLAFLAWTCYKLRDATIFYRIFSGRLFAEQWDMEEPFVQPKLGRAYIVLVGVAVIVLPYLAWVRTICARKTRFEYWTFVISTALVCLFLICINTVPVCILIKWMQVAGKGLEGVLVGIVGYIVVLWFFLWAIWPPKRNEESENLSILDVQSGAQL